MHPILDAGSSKNTWKEESEQSMINRLCEGIGTGREVKREANLVMPSANMLMLNSIGAGYKNRNGDGDMVEFRSGVVAD